MTETFDLFRYVRYTRRRWRFLAIACGSAVAIATIGSILASRQYTATARIVIEPPAGTDPRSALAVSPIYLESLKTYEEFASGDSLFHSAVERYRLRDSLGNRPIESLKKKILKVALVRNTRILEISATLPDPRRAQQFAEFIAQATVDENQQLIADGARDLLGGLSIDQQQARTRADAADAAWAREAALEPVEELQAAVENAAELRIRIQEDVLNAEVDLASAVQRAKESKSSPEAQAEAAGAQARLDQMRKQLAGLDSENAAREKLLDERTARRDHLEAERKSAQTALAAIDARVRESRADAGYRGERLKIIDPGIVPEKPSTPNVPLNLAAALLLGTVLPLVYLAFEMNYREEPRAFRTVPVLPLARANRE